MARDTKVTGSTRQPERVLVGHCPECGRVVVVENHHESWPLVTCACGWRDGTTAIRNGRLYERAPSPFVAVGVIVVSDEDVQ